MKTELKFETCAPVQVGWIVATGVILSFVVAILLGALEKTLAIPAPTCALGDNDLSNVSW